MSKRKWSVTGSSTVLAGRDTVTPGTNWEGKNLLIRTLPCKKCQTVCMIIKSMQQSAVIRDHDPDWKSLDRNLWWFSSRLLEPVARTSWRFPIWKPSCEYYISHTQGSVNRLHAQQWYWSARERDNRPRSFVRHFLNLSIILQFYKASFIDKLISDVLQMALNPKFILHRSLTPV